MRLKAALVIIVLAFAITTANLASNLILARQSLTETMGKDITLALDIANDLVSTRISFLESNTQTIAQRLQQADSSNSMENLMREQLALFPEIMALTVFDRQGLVASYGDSPASTDWPNNSTYLNSAFSGSTVISTTRDCETTGELVMYVYTRMDPNRVLSATVPGMMFSELLQDYRLWNTGNIFMIDGEGTVIAHIIPELVTTRANFTDELIESGQQKTIKFFDEMLQSERGLGTYLYDDVEYQCAYTRVLESGSNWRIGLSVPLGESPVAQVQNSLLILAIIFFVVSVLVALVASGAIARPYKKITEQNKRLEELNEINQSQTHKIQEAHQLTKLMMDSTPICSMLWNKDGTIFDCNEESVKHFGMKDKQDFLDRFFDLSPVRQPCGHKSRDLAEKYIRMAFKHGRVCLEWHHQLLDGTPIPCEMTLVRVRYGGDYIVAAYARDLRNHKEMMEETNRLQTELEAALKDAQTANRAKSNFLASMSHEMRTPLNAVIGLSELVLYGGEVRGETEDRLDKIHCSGMTLLGIVNDILDISKIESGRFELNPIEYDTPSLINDIVSLNTIRIGERPIQFNLLVDEDLPRRLFGDDLRVKQIFNNLLSNAFKYTHEGKVEWTVSFEQQDNVVWLISDISDTGIGIKEEDIPKLFRDYSQVDAQTNRQAEGTGLGLSITKRLLSIMDGSIEVSSEYGKGTTFSVRLPQQLVSAEPIGTKTVENLIRDRFAATKRGHHARLVRIDLSYARVLVVDDMQTNLDVAKGMLTPYGIHTDCATSGQQAIEMIRAEEVQYDAVFMDHMMPGMDGIEALRIIREEIDTDYARNVPIIALTANAIVGNEKMFLEQGFQAFISKPIDMFKLDAALRLWVRKKEREQERDLARGFCLVGEHQAEEIGDDPVFQVSSEAPNSAFLDTIAIDGIDIGQGLKRFANDEEAYMNLLKSYLVNTRPLLDEMTQQLALGDLEGYAIVVHGIKGTSFGLGAFATGEMAMLLEQLARAGDREQLLAKNTVFIDAFESLFDSIEDVLSLYSTKNQKPLRAYPEPLLILSLRDACHTYDVSRVDAAIAKIESFAYQGEGEELVIWLREQIDEMNYEVIAGDDWPLATYATKAKASS